MRKVKYSFAINEAFDQCMAKYDNMYLMGQGLESPWSVGKSTCGLTEKYGESRVIDTPISENGITGIAIGSAMAGMRPVMLHPRMDFMYYAMDQIVNHAASWHYMFDGKVNVPITIRGIINRGNEQAAQHSQALQALFCHVPGLKVVMPSNAYDAKGLLISSIEDNGPVLYIDDRLLYDFECEVPEEMYRVPLGRGVVCRKGKDVTIVATSFMVQESLKAAGELEKDGISVEVIDPRTLKPLDEEIIYNSLKNTGKLVVVDAAWKSCGFAGEVAALVGQNAFEFLKAPIKRVTLPDTPAPASISLEDAYFVRSRNIISAVKKVTKFKG